MKKMFLKKTANVILSTLFVIGYYKINYFEQAGSYMQTSSIDSFFSILLIAGFIVGGRKLYIQEKGN